MLFNPPRFVYPDQDRAAIAMMQRLRFGTVVSIDDNEPQFSHLPLLVDAADGKLLGLRGHFARANPPTTAYAGPSSAAKVGVTDYRAGVDKAMTGLPALLGAPPTAGTATGTGFGDYHEGVLAFAAGTPAIANRSGHAAGWQHAHDGDAEAAKQISLMELYVFTPVVTLVRFGAWGGVLE